MTTENICKDVNLVRVHEVRTSTDDSNVVYCCVQTQITERKKLSSLSDVMARFSSEKPKFNSQLSDARKELSEVLYGEEVSLRKMRMSYGWSQTQLAETLKTSQAQIAKIESGKSDAQLSTIQKLSKAFNISIGTMAEILSKGKC